jgi:hypothetical protein
MMSFSWLELFDLGQIAVRMYRSRTVSRESLEARVEKPRRLASANIA